MINMKVVVEMPLSKEILNFCMPINTIMLSNTHGSCYVINCTGDNLGISCTVGTMVTSAGKSMLRKNNVGRVAQSV